MRVALLFLFCALAANSAELPKTDAAFPFRTDFANEHLPWYQLKPGEFPPLHSEHRVGGELVEADFIHRSGQFRAEGTGELVDFTLPPFGTVMYLNTEADLRDEYLVDFATRAVPRHAVNTRAGLNEVLSSGS